MHPQELVKRITEERADVFGGFYTPYLTDCARQIGEGLTGDESVVDAGGVLESALRSLMGVCVQTGVRTLIASFHAAGGTYEEFHDRVRSHEGRQELLTSFPELDRLLRLSAARTARNVREALESAVMDRDALAEVLGVRGAVTSVSTGLGDAHRGGRSVCLVEFGDGTRAVHKPQQDNCLSLLASVRGLLDVDGSFFGPLYPRSVVRPTHVWQEFVEHEQLEDADREGAVYFRRFGRVAALLGMLGTTDLHHENIIARREGPVVIDTETLVSLPHSAPVTAGATAAAADTPASAAARAALNLDVERSVLNTLLFPVRYTEAKLDIDISGIGCVAPGPSGNIQSFTVVDAGTDDIRFDRIPVVVEHGANMAEAHGELLDPRDWVDEISAGFHEARELLAAHRESVETVVRDSVGWKVRQVVRPTYIYARFLEASTHPVHLGSRRDRAELLAKLPRHYRGTAPEAAEAVHREEVAALLDLDVPFFTVDCDSPSLRGDLDEEIAGISGMTPREAALEAVRSLFTRPPQRDTTYLRYALAGSVDDIWDARRAARREVHPDLADPRPWYGTLRELVVGDAEAPTWLMPRLQGDGLRLGWVDGALYDSGGLLLHLAAVEQLTGTAPLGVDMARVARAALPPRFDVRPEAFAMSPFTGALSALVTDWEIRRLKDPAAPFAAVEVRPAEQPLDVESLTAADFDHLNGYSGYLVHLATGHRHGVPELTGVPSERLLKRLVDVDGSPEVQEGELGLAHGRFGRITAMSAMLAAGLDGDSGTRRHLERFAEAYLRHRWQDEVLRDPAAGNGWCKGYAGVAYAAGELLAALGEPAGRIRAALAGEVDRIVTGDLGRDISFCHGLAGRIAVLCHLADRFHWPELRDEAAALRTGFLDRHRAGGSRTGGENGGRGSGTSGWTGGAGTEPHLPSFFLGLAGWHHAQLMLDHPGSPGAALPRCLGGLS